MGGSLATVFTDDVGDDCGEWGMGASLIRGDVGFVSLEPEGCAQPCAQKELNTGYMCARLSDER